MPSLYNYTVYIYCTCRFIGENYLFSPLLDFQYKYLNVMLSVTLGNLIGHGWVSPVIICCTQAYIIGENDLFQKKNTQLKPRSFKLTSLVDMRFMMELPKNWKD